VKDARRLARSLHRLQGSDSNLCPVSDAILRINRFVSMHAMHKSKLMRPPGEVLLLTYVNVVESRCPDLSLFFPEIFPAVADECTELYTEEDDL